MTATANETLRDPVWGELAPRLGFYEPVPVEVLAEQMQRGSWLDMRVEDVPETIQRVRVVELRIRVQGEDVVVRQDWLKGDEFRHAEHVFTAELIWKIRKSQHKVEDVKPYSAELDEDAGPPLTAQEVAEVREAALQRVAKLRACTPLDLMNPTGDAIGHIDARHLLLLTLYECTNERPADLCKTLGWRSVQPFMTAKWKASPNARRTIAKYNELRRQLESACKAVRRDTGLGSRARRTVGSVFA